MSDSEIKYSSEYVEMKTMLEHIRTRLEMMDVTLRDIQSNTLDNHKQVEQNRADIAGVKASATILGALAGTLVAVLTRIMFAWKLN